MPLTLVEVRERLKRIDEISLLEVLGLTAEDIVERCHDIIEDKYDKLVEDLEDEETEEDR